MMHDEEGMYDPVPCPLNPDFNHEDHAEKNGVRSQLSTNERTIFLSIEC
ncbi:MAG: hypothetical protein H6Q45_269 [Deltaproteobacteria bacterium]|nr:hypothetical protein [Deltaproteobacteria bacterium]